MVERRDTGVCAQCGMDTEYVKRLLNPLLREAKHRAEKRHEFDLSKALRQRVSDALLELGFSDSVARVASDADKYWWSGEMSVHLWEMDHIVPVSEGGGGCGLENLRTLCRACHRHATKALAARLAKTKRIRRKQAEHEKRMAEKNSC